MDKGLNVLVEAEATEVRYAIRSTVGYAHEWLRSAHNRLRLGEDLFDSRVLRPEVRQRRELRQVREDTVRR